MLTPRELKGLNFEKLVHKKLRENAPDVQWIRAPKADFKVTEGQYTIEIEAKFSHAKIFPCWVKRDWISRFSRDCWDRIVVVNRGMKLPERSKALLKQHRIQVVFYDQITLVLQAILGAIKYLKGNHSLNTDHYFERKVKAVCVMFKLLSMRLEQFLRKKWKEKVAKPRKERQKSNATSELPINKKEAMQMGMLVCARCGFTTDDEGEAGVHAFEEHGLEVEECFSTEEKLAIDDTPEPEENLDESEGLTEEEVKGAIVLENYSQIDDDTLKKQILSVALGQSTNHDKKFPEQIKLSDVPQEYLRQFRQKIEGGLCPVSGCGVHYTQLGQNLSKEAEDDLKEELILDHISKEHPLIWTMVKHLFQIPEKSDLPSQQKTWTPNPESCSKEMNNEELSQEIASNPELRAKLFRAWKALEETKNRSQ